VSIYNAAVLATNPLLGARLTNTTGKLLPQGPLTVLDNGVYAGDAKIDDLPAGQDRLLSFGIDQQVLVHANDQTNTSHLTSARIVKGVLQLINKQEFSQQYTAQNKGKTDRMLLIEHPKRAGWTLADPAKAAESTDALYRFQQPLAAGKSQSLTIKEQRTNLQSIVILPMDTGSLETYTRTGPIPQPVKDALAKAARLKYALADTQRQIQAHQQQINDFNADQTRIRENMKTVAPTSDYYQKLLKKLDDQETAIEKLQAESKQLQQQSQQQQKELEDYLVALDVG
jgi:septal ring factor EnvC (AmiA/AmiB activator)